MVYYFIIKIQYYQFFQIMKTFCTPHKENIENLSSPLGKFYPRVRRQQQMGKINEIIFNENLLEDFKSIRQLNHFKKNNNKIESNIQDHKDQLRAIKNMKKRRIDCESSTQNYRKCKRIHQQQLMNSCTEGVSPCFKPMTSLEMVKKHNIYPRYKILQLYGLYRSILQYSERDPKKFLHALQSALNYQKIMIKSEIVKKNFYEQKRMQFTDFLAVYKKMQDLMFIQSIIDYLQIIFEVYTTECLTYDLIYQILVKRSDHSDAITITDIIYKKLNADKNEIVKLLDILDLCERDIEFCSTFSKLYHKEVM